MSLFDRIHDALDADQMRARLWQGSHPPSGAILAELGFSMAVFCAAQLQPEPEDYPGITVVLAPNDDEPRLPRDNFEIALDAARRVAHEHRRGGRILVACHAGLNRSGLVMALAMSRMYAHRRAMARIVDRIQTRRPESGLPDPLTSSPFRPGAVEMRDRDLPPRLGPGRLVVWGTVRDPVVFQFEGVAAAYREALLASPRSGRRPRRPPGSSPGSLGTFPAPGGMPSTCTFHGVSSDSDEAYTWHIIAKRARLCIPRRPHRSWRRVDAAPARGRTDE